MERFLYPEMIPDCIRAYYSFCQKSVLALNTWLLVGFFAASLEY